MGARDREGTDHGRIRRNPAGRRDAVGATVNAAISRGFVIGREVMVGSIPGIVVGYNIAAVGTFLGKSYPLVVRTELGVTKCALNEVSLV